jgi:hypothetical protein
MKSILAPALSIGVVLGLSGQSIAAEAELAAPVAACIRDNAAKVEQAIPSLTDGVQFLVGHICAREVSAEAQRQVAENQRQTRERMRKMCDELAKQPQPQPAGNERSYLAMFCDPAAMRVGFDAYDGLGGGYTAYFAIGGAQGGPASTALAARLLLDLRLARQAREGQR